MTSPPALGTNPSMKRLVIVSALAILPLAACASIEKAEARFGEALTEHSQEQEAARSAYEAEVERIYRDHREELITLEEKTEQLAAAADARELELATAWTKFKEETVSAGEDALHGIPTTGNGWMDLVLGGGGLLGVFNAYRNRSMPGTARKLA